jgi:hypothetical protein
MFSIFPPLASWWQYSSRKNIVVKAERKNRERQINDCFTSWRTLIVVTSSSTKGLKVKYLSILEVSEEESKGERS